MNVATYKKVRIRAGSGRRYRDNGASVAVRRQLTPITGADVSYVSGRIHLNLTTGTAVMRENVSEPHTQLSHV